MTTLVVCLDGTNQVKTQPHPTNIAKLFDCLGGAATDAGSGSFESLAAGPPACAGKYLPGVGTQGNPILKLLGAAFGDGLAELVVRGYTFLSRNYAPGDDIFITGFSRGAAAARALAGFVVGQGLLEPDRYDPALKNDAYVRAIAAWYHNRRNTNFADQARLQLIARSLGQAPPQLDDVADFVSVSQIRAVGVFDTVSSLGLPHFDANGDAVFDFSICDTNLNPKVALGFHALAADESRELFSPTFWATRDGVEQVVFPGAHSNVGGGYPECGLSDGALDWMLSRLEAAGLAVDRSQVDIQPDAHDLARDDGASFPFDRTPRRARGFPASAQPSETLAARWDKEVETWPELQPKPYRPAGSYTDGTPIYPLPGP